MSDHPAMPRLLLAYDGSDCADGAIGTAAQLFPAAEAVVVYVYEKPVGLERVVAAGAFPTESVKESLDALAQEEAEEARAVAEAGQTCATDAGLSATAVAVPSKRAEWHDVLAAAERENADLIVCGTRGQGPIGRAILGSTSSSLVHQADRPVLVVPSGEHDVSGPLVIAYDGSDDARKAVVTVGSLFPGRAAVVVHAWSWPIDTAADVATKRAALEIAEEGRDLAEQHGLSAASEVRETTDALWRAVSAHATEINAALVAAGSRGRGALKSMLLGSVSASLAHRAERPTLIVGPTG